MSKSKNVRFIVDWNNQIDLEIKQKDENAPPKIIKGYTGRYVDFSKYTASTIKELTAQYGIRGKKRYAEVS